MSQTWPEFLARYQGIPYFQTKVDLNRSNCHKCTSCVHEEVDMNEEPCVSCCWIYPEMRNLKSNWKYRYLIEKRYCKEEPCIGMKLVVKGGDGES